MDFLDKNKLFANYENGLLEGEIKHIFASGKYYEGKFHKGMFDGPGIMVHKETSEIVNFTGLSF
jgi:hypothetical protein